MGVVPNASNLYGIVERTQLSFADLTGRSNHWERPARCAESASLARLNAALVAPNTRRDIVVGMTGNLLLISATHIPPGFYLRIGVEPRDKDDPDADFSDGDAFLYASIYQEPPDYGWSVQGVDQPGALGLYHEVLGSTSPGAFHPADKHRDLEIWTVSAVTMESLEALTIHGILERWPTTTLVVAPRRTIDSETSGLLDRLAREAPLRESAARALGRDASTPANTGCSDCDANDSASACRCNVCHRRTR